MSVKVLIAHAKGEESQAERLAEPIRKAGYEVVHEGTIIVGDSVVAEVSKLLAQGCPVVLCGTVKAMGTKWARQVANAAKAHLGVRLFVVQMEEEADTDTVSFDEVIARHWQDANKAETDLISALQKLYPPDSGAQHALRVHDLESRYRELALKACDIIDLANLPEDDRHLASRELELRRLYVALRMRSEVQAGDLADDETLAALEQRRASAWGGGGRRSVSDEGLVSLGERLAAVPRLVVLGDPGAGKSTLLRWLATAYLLRLQAASDWRDLPDIASLPETNWLPILIRCRDLPPDAVTLDDMLQHSLRKSELTEEQCTSLRQLLRRKLEHGEALLLVDGLDEITDPGARARFAEQLEQIYRAHNKAPIVVTSRIVGYREMGYRIRSGFEHLTVADLTSEDKDDFARRWCALTERGARREEAAADLIHDIHSSDRIERLTGNPMLLTTMALIKRKIGRLPQRRVDLYQKAVEVLLNWRSAVDAALDPREALPQLEYLAHAMCSEGIQQVREDQALELLRLVRNDFPHIHALQQHTPEDFLALLERRTGLLVQSGLTRHNGHSVPVYEFRHLTIQEYLAGIALVQGHYRGREKNQALADAIAPLAGQVGADLPDLGEPDTAVVENWREVLRLCLAACNDEAADQCLLAILRPLSGETGTARPRAVLAALCLADEPSVSDTVAAEVLRDFVAAVREDDAGGRVRSLFDTAAAELAVSRWSNLLCERLMDEFFRCEAIPRAYPGVVYSRARAAQVPHESGAQELWLNQTAARLSKSDEREAAGIALTVMYLAYQGRNCQVPGMADSLIRRLAGGAATSHAAAWALGWMTDKQRQAANPWHPSPAQMNELLAAVSRPDCDSETLRWLSSIFCAEPIAEAVVPLLSHIPTSPPNTLAVILKALGAIGDPEGIAVVRGYLRDKEESVRIGALSGLARTCEDEIDRKLLFPHFEHMFDALDPLSPITESRIAKAAKQLKMTEKEIRQRYQRLAALFDLTLAPRKPKTKAKAKSRGGKSNPTRSRK